MGALSQPVSPRISVIIVCFRSLPTLPRVLDALQRQTVTPSEVILVDSGDDGAADYVKSRYGHVRVIQSEHRLYPGDARNLAIQHARGDLIAFLDADCIPAADWMEQTLAAHILGGQSIAGGSVANAECGAVAWASYFCEFSSWMPDQPSTVMADVPTCSLSASADLLKSHPFLHGTYCSDTAWNWTMGRRLETIRFVPSIRVSHLGHRRALPWLRKNTMHGRAFARVRTRERSLSPGMAMLLAAGCGVLPVLLTWRTARRVWIGGQFRRQFLGCLPLVLAGHTAWSAGEWAGYLEALSNWRHQN